MDLTKKEKNEKWLTDLHLFPMHVTIYWPLSFVLWLLIQDIHDAITGSKTFLAMRVLAMSILQPIMADKTIA